MIVEKGKLFCSECREIISSKKSVLKIHISSKKHQNGKEKLKKSKLKDQTIIEAFRREGSSKDSTLPEEECAYRLEVFSEFLKAGIPIGKIDMLRSALLEKNSYNFKQYFLTHRRLMNLKLELAATIDVGEHFVKATYFLEGDGPLVFACYEKLSTVSQLCQATCFLNVCAIAAAISEEDPCQNVTALERSAKACVEPAITWFLRKFNVDLYDVVVAFKAFRLFCPVRIQWLKPTNALVESLRAFPFLDSNTTIDGLRAELPAYLAAAEDVVIPTDEKKVECLIILRIEHNLRFFFGVKRNF